MDADAAELHGDGIKVEQHGGRSNLGFWDAASDWASWKVDFTRPGVYKVTARCACTDGRERTRPGSRGQQVVAKVAQTGDWEQFRDVAFGTVEIAKAGVQEVKVRPRDPNAWRAVNLRDVKFAPAKK